MLIIICNTVNAQPSLHTISGKIYNSGGSNVPNDIPVRITLMYSNYHYLTYTYGPPPSPNNYVVDANSSDGEMVFVYARNRTHYGVNHSYLVDFPGITNIDVTLNRKMMVYKTCTAEEIYP